MRHGYEPPVCLLLHRFLIISIGKKKKNLYKTDSYTKQIFFFFKYFFLGFQKELIGKSDFYPLALDLYYESKQILLMVSTLVLNSTVSQQEKKNPRFCLTGNDIIIPTIHSEM